MLRRILHVLANQPDRGEAMRVVAGYKGTQPKNVPRRLKLGNIIARLLAAVGITKRRWRAMRGRYRVVGGCATAILVRVPKSECGCRDRQRAFNRITVG